MKKKELIDLITESKIIHNNFYDYSLIKEHIDMHFNNDIICPKHGVFKQSFHMHIDRKRGCKSCAIDKKKDTKATFINKALLINDNKYDYSDIIYKNSKTLVEIKCNICNKTFKQKPNDHLNKKQGCPNCKKSKGENIISKILDNNYIIYEQQKYLNGCKYKKPLKFDFYLTEYNICIEYDGEQHFKSVNIWGGNDNFYNIIKRDEIKNNYCINNDIYLFRIRYDDIIEEKMNILINDINNRSYTKNIE